MCFDCSDKRKFCHKTKNRTKQQKKQALQDPWRKTFFFPEEQFKFGEKKKGRRFNKKKRN